MKSILGLPAHPLFVHAPLVLMPLLALLGLGLAVRPAWRVRYGPLAVIGSLAVVISSILATQSGEGFEEALEDQGQKLSIEHHAELGEMARNFALLFFVLMVALVALSWYRRSPQPVLASASSPVPPAAGQGGAVVMAGHVLAALVVIVGLLGSIWMFRAGHAGADAVWEGTIPSGE